LLYVPQPILSLLTTHYGPRAPALPSACNADIHASKRGLAVLPLLRGDININGRPPGLFILHDICWEGCHQIQQS